MSIETGVLVTIFNRRTEVFSSVSSIVSTLPQEVPILLIDDGSTDGALEVASQFSERCRVIRNANNIGLCASSNLGMRELKAVGVRNVIRVNSDVVVTGNWYAEMCGALEDPSVGVVGPLYSSFGTSGHWPNQSGGQKTDAREFKYRPVPCIVGHCIGLSHGLIGSAFRFDEGMYPVGPCDVDLCCYSTAHGFRNVVALKALCALLPSPKSTLNHPKFDYEKCFPEYQKTIKARYGSGVYDATVAFQYKLFK